MKEKNKKTHSISVRVDENVDGMLQTLRERKMNTSEIICDILKKELPDWIESTKTVIPRKKSFGLLNHVDNDSCSEEKTREGEPKPTKTVRSPK